MNQLENGPIHLESRAVEVTLFEDRAQVIREVQLAIQPGVSRIRITGVTPLVDDKSLTVSAPLAEGKIQILSGKVVRGLRGISKEAVTAKTSAIRKRLNRGFLHVRQRDFARSQIRRFQEAFGQLVNGLATIPSAEEIPSWMAALKKASDALERGLEDKVKSQWNADRELKEAHRLQKELNRLRLANPCYYAEVEVQLEASVPVENAVLRLDYRTPCALWRPEYDACLTSVNLPEGTAEIQLIRRGAVWQMTGENWQEVKLSFSTARPAGNAVPPKLREDMIVLRKKTSEESKTVTVVARNQKIESVVDSSEVLGELPGVDDGGETRIFHAPATSTIPSDGRVAHVHLETLNLKAAVEMVAFPELSSAVHLKASAKLPGGMPVLAGPVALIRDGSFIGKSNTGYVAPGDDLILGFGTDDDIRIRRTVKTIHREATLTGKSAVKRSVTVMVSNMSDERRSFTLQERVPVSEIEGVKVTVDELNGFSVPDQDGKIRATVCVDGNGGQCFEYVFTVTADGNINLKF